MQYSALATQSRTSSRTNFPTY